MSCHKGFTQALQLGVLQNKIRYQLVVTNFKIPRKYLNNLITIRKKLMLKSEFGFLKLVFKRNTKNLRVFRYI
jgi:hypothetical protein